MVGWEDQGRTGKKVEELDAGIGLEGRRRKGWNGVKEGAEGSGAQLVRCTPNTEHCQPWDDGSFRHNCTTARGRVPACCHLQLSLPSLIMTTSEIGDRGDIVSHLLKGICQSC